MAQLPPKVPNWPHLANSGHHQSTWIDDFLDFSSNRRGTHRRSASDSVAFLESPMSLAAAEPQGLDDDDHLMSAFSDEVAAEGAPSSSSLPSTPPSDQNSNDEDMNMMMAMSAGLEYGQFQPAKREAAGEEESSWETDLQAALAPDCAGGGSDLTLDPKRVKRILANRQSAQRSRVRKLQYISELERSVTSLQAEVSALSPRVAFLDHQRLILNVDNSTLKQRIAALAQDKIFKDAHQEALKKEIERLRQVCHHQNLIKKMNEDILNDGSATTTPSLTHHMSPSGAVGCTDKQCQVN